MQERATLESLSARVDSLEQFARDMRDVSETLTLLTAQHARELEQVISGLAAQIRERTDALIGAGPPAN